MTSRPQPPRPATAEAQLGRVAPVVAGRRRVDTRDLLGDDRELIVVHKETEYRLRLTNNDKLILTK